MRGGVMEESPIRSIVLGTAVLLAACTPPAAPERPNLLLVTLDTTRADRLGCYGGPAGGTPTIDALAAEGVRVERASATVPLTLPSHASILTGLYPPSHGVRDNAGFRLPSDLLTLAERLGEEGYRSAAVVGSYVLDRSFGLDQGFEFYDGPQPVSRLPPQGRELVRVELLERPGDEVTARAETLLSRLGDGPWFLWVHYYDPHVTYEPPEPWRSRYADDPYQGEIAFVDAQLARLRAAAAASARPLLTVLTADHGEGLGDHGEATHGLFVYESTMHVPLIFHWPGRVPATTLPGPASIVDVMPTVLELSGVPAVPAVQGRSLAPRFAGEGGAWADVYAESLFAQRVYGWAPLAAIYRGTRKTIEAPVPERYDLARDPEERDDLAAAEGRALAADLERLRGLRDGWPAAPGEPDRPLDAEQQARLASLGYLGGGGSDPANAGRDPKQGLATHEELLAANDAIARGAAAEARRLVERVLTREPDNPLALSLGGKLAVAVREHELGLARLRRAVELAADPARAESDLAAGLDHAGRTAEAVAAYRRALALRGDEPRDHFGLGNLLARSGEPAAALEAYARVEALGVDEPRLDAAIGVALLRSGDRAAGEARLHAAVQGDPGLADAWNQLGILAERRGDRAAAREEYGRALQAQPDHADARFNRGKAALLAGDLPAARRDLQRLAATHPDYPAAAFLEGQLALAEGDPVTARRALRRFLARPDADPRLAAAARDILARLE